MTTSDSGAPGSALTPEERARLRPTVDAVAFERFLAEVPVDARPEFRRAALLHFAMEVTADDVRAFLTALGNTEALSEIERALAAIEAEPLPEPTVHPASGPGTVSYVAVPTVNHWFTIEPPEEPRLRELWDAIERKA